MSLERDIKQFEKILKEEVIITVGCRNGKLKILKIESESYYKGDEEDEEPTPKGFKKKINPKRLSYIG